MKQPQDGGAHLSSGQNRNLCGYLLPIVTCSGCCLQNGHESHVLSLLLRENNLLVVGPVGEPSYNQLFAVFNFFLSKMPVHFLYLSVT
jgi:hypothetical protein